MRQQFLLDSQRRSDCSIDWTTIEAEASQGFADHLREMILFYAERLEQHASAPSPCAREALDRAEYREAMHFYSESNMR